MGEPAYKEWSGPDRRRPLLGSVSERLDEMEEEFAGLLWLFPIPETREAGPVRPPTGVPLPAPP